MEEKPLRQNKALIFHVLPVVRLAGEKQVRAADISHIAVVNNVSFHKYKLLDMVFFCCTYNKIKTVPYYGQKSPPEYSGGLDFIC